MRATSTCSRCCSPGFALAGIGAGKWSIDWHIDSTWLFGWKGLLIAAVFGVGGAATLLAVYWKPEKKADRLSDVRAATRCGAIWLAPSLTVTSDVASGLNATASPCSSDGSGALHGAASNAFHSVLVPSARL